MGIFYRLLKYINIQLLKKVFARRCIYRLQSYVINSVQGTG